MRMLLTIILCVLLFGPIPVLILGGLSFAVVCDLVINHPFFDVFVGLFVAKTILGALAKAVKVAR